MTRNTLNKTIKIRILSIVIMLIVGIGNTVIAQQQDTIYFNTHWNPTTKIKAVYYRLKPAPKVGDLYHIQDFYINGALQMDGYSVKQDEDAFHGQVIWYYKHGTPKNIRHYNKGKLEGKSQSFFSNGSLQAEGVIKDNQYWNGSFEISSSSEGYKTKVYQDGCLKAKHQYYKDNFSIASTLNFNCSNYHTSEVFYDKNGKEISQLIYDNSNNKPIPLSGTEQLFILDNEEFVLKSIGTRSFSGNKDLQHVKTKLAVLTDTLRGTNKSGYRFEGTFYTNGKIVNFVNKKKEGETQCCFNASHIKAKGVYKNNQKHHGTFYNPRTNTISSYKNGYRDGAQITYDAAGDVIKQETFKEGKRDGLFITHNPFTKTKHQCIYKNNYPFEGEELQYNTLTNYMNGKRIEITEYDYDTHQPISKTRYDLEDKYKITSKTIYDQGNSYALEYKNGMPFKGIEKNNNGFKTFANGEATGPYEIFAKNYLETGQYIAYNKHGLITIKLKDRTLQCVYDNGKPINGVDYNSLSGQQITYTNGIKNGLNIETRKNIAAYDSLTRYYKNNKPVGKLLYFKNGTLVNTSSYKNGKPYNGTFYQYNSTKTYKKGKLVESVINDEHYGFKQHFYYSNDGVSKLKTTNTKDSITYTLSYNNRSPFQGHFFGKLPSTINYILTPYEKGKKHGEEIVYTHPFKDISYTQNYIQGIKEGTSSYYFKGQIFEGTYKNDLPYDGDIGLAYSEKDILCVSQYIKGKAQQQNCFDNNKYESRVDTIFSGTYKNGKPYSGVFINKNRYHVAAKTYEEGKLQKTFVNPLKYKYLRASLNISHHKQTDSIVNKRLYTAVVHYTNDEKTSGHAIYKNSKDETIGTIRFNNGSLTDADLSLLVGQSPVSLKTNNASTVVLHVESVNGIQARAEASVHLNKKLHLFLYDVLSYFQKRPSAKLRFYNIKTSKKLLEITFKEGKPYHGTMPQLQAFNKELSQNIELKTYVSGILKTRKSIPLEDFLKGKFKQ